MTALTRVDDVQHLEPKPERLGCPISQFQTIPAICTFHIRMSAVKGDKSSKSKAAPSGSQVGLLTSF